MKTVVLLAAAATALSVAPAAFADDPSKVVVFEQSQLATAEGLQELRADIHDAAEDVCVVPAQPTLSERRMRSQCIEGAVEAAEAQLQQKLADLGTRQFAQIVIQAEADIN